jgi:predicted helicase
MAISEKALKSINSLNDLLEFLGAELGWEINLEELDKAMYRFSPEELGVSHAVAEKIRSIRQLKPATAGQPWGIFLLDLSGVGLSKKAVREVLKKLTARGRGLANPGMWNKQDLLFLVSSGSGEKTEIHLMTFRDREDRVAEMLSIDWKPRHMTPMYLKTLRTELLPRLAWPEDQAQTDQWRDRWSKAFFLKPGQSMKDADVLVERMAQTAIAIRKSIESGFKDKLNNAPLIELMDDLKKNLVSNVDIDSFADMCAQTITYGLLAARVQDPEGFGASPVLNELPLENEFLQSIFGKVQSAISGFQRDEESLQELYFDLRATNVENILVQFGNTSDGGDPVIHFYETFLSRYDSRQKIKTGSFYTPKRLVDGMVNIVDDLLKSKFKLSLGLADDSTWGKVASDVGFELPPGINSNSRFLSILDPATGTGTYLVSLFDKAQSNLKGVNLTKEEIAKRLLGSFSDSLHAFELMLAPYSIANLKMGMKYSEFGDVHKKNIFLANTLETGARRSALFAEDEPSAISEEGEKALELKRTEPFTVIIGNPPYGVDSTQGAGSGGKAKLGEEIRFGDPHYFSKPPISDFISTFDGYKGKLPPISALYDLYTYFWRWSIWQTIQKPIHYPLGQDSKEIRPKSCSPGVVSFVTNRSFIDAPTFAGFRRFLRENFDEIQVIDLGGNSRASAGDENVFPIQTGVAIMTAVRYSSEVKRQPCKVRYIRLEGRKQSKLSELTSLGFSSGSEVESEAGNPWANLKPDNKGLLSQMDFLDGFFERTSGGCLPRRTWVSAASKAVLKKRWETLLLERDPDLQDELLKAKEGHNVDSIKSSVLDTQNKLTPIRLLSPGTKPEMMSRYSYRPFDNQYVIADGRLFESPARSFWQIANERNFWFGSGIHLTGGPSMFVFSHVPDFHAYSGRGGSDFSPAFLDFNCTHHNLSTKALTFSKKLADSQTDEAFWGYMYGIHGTGAYYDAFRSELRESPERARLPLTTSKNIFSRISEIGLALLHQHLGRDLPKGSKQLFTPFVADPANLSKAPEKVSYNFSEAAIYFDEQLFCNIPEEIWGFEANNLRVVKSWLENRKASPKGKRSSPLDDINETKWIYNDEFIKMIADVSAVIEAKKLVMPLMEQLVEEIKNQPGK